MHLSQLQRFFKETSSTSNKRYKYFSGLRERANAVFVIRLKAEFYTAKVYVCTYVYTCV